MASKSVTMVFGSDLEGWEREGFSSLVTLLKQQVDVHRIDLPNENQSVRLDAPGDLFWVCARRWERVVEKTIFPRDAQILASILGQSLTRDFVSNAFWKNIHSAIPDHVALIAHSPLSYRFLTEMQRFDSQRSFYLPLPAFSSQAREKASSQKPFTVGVLGHFVPDQNYNFMSNIAHAVLAKNQNIRFVFIGEGPLDFHINRLVDEMGLSAKVSCTRWASAHFKDLDLLLYAPLQNFHFMPLLYAGANSIPVIACELPGIEDYIVPGESGVVVPIHETEAVTDQILKFSSDAGARLKFGQGLQRVISEKFSSSRVAPFLNTLFGSGAADTQRAA